MSEPEKPVADETTAPKLDDSASSLDANGAADVATATTATPAPNDPSTLAAHVPPSEASLSVVPEVVSPGTVAAQVAAPPAEIAVAAPLAPVQPTPAIDPSTLEPPVPSGPYRTAPYEPPPARVGPTPWPILGPALTSFGALLWTFVVAGQFTTSWSTGKPLAQTTALGAVGIVSVVAWVLAVRRSRFAAPPSGSHVLVARGLASGLLAVLFFAICVVGAVFLAEASRTNHDLLVAFVLVAFSITAHVVGGKITAPEPPERTHGQKFVTVALWVVSLLLTLVAGADLAANG